ncbi:FAD-dependent monooxygenase [Streptomyces sp. TLI_105]|uniref:FAD-dependent monooxygenase n=1 Tax=Streptomyces sp. TLI_105 TaxID=1881019 RepID=UPI0008979DFD|nr:FAD-dependent monooxygenase [Streptomyces sp. TLI_105]SEC29380.1 2-polyprenyl-6-methoxyphenol hydroxylase [Streptomyces sp. TLI_105]
MDTDVVIVGAGPTGLVLAIDLARRGVRALLVEKADRLFLGSRGKGIQPRSQEVFDDLGALPAIRAAGSPYPRMLGWEGAERQGEWDMVERSEPTEQVPYAEVLLIPQSRTQEVLYERLVELGGDVLFGTALTGLRQSEEGVVAELSTGETVRASYLVASDGGRSTVRKALGIGMTGETVDPRPMLVADVRLSPDAIVDRGNWHIWPKAPGGGVALCPLPGGDQFQLIAAFEDEAAVEDTTPEAVRALVAARTPLTGADIVEVVWASGFRARAAMADRFRDGRVFLAGDAAHVHSPAGGQGLNTSVQDAYNLGWKLGQVLRHGAPPALLDSYEAERQSIAADVLGISTRIHRAGAGGESTQRGAEVQQLGLGYRDSTLSVETRDGLADDALRAGDRAPDGPCGEGRLFDLFRGPHFTLLGVGVPLPVSVPEQLRTARLAAYEPYGTGLFLIRPDGYVGWAGATADGLDDYLTTVGGGRPESAGALVPADA